MKKQISLFLAAILVLSLFCSTAFADSSTPMAYTDVAQDDPFYDAIEYATVNNIMNGMGNDLFQPASSLTRAMLVTVLYRMEGEPVCETELPFADVAEGEYYTEAVRWAFENGIVNGMSETEFAPALNVTREQMAAILYRYAEPRGYGLDERSADTNTLSAEDIFDVSSWAAPAVHCCLATDILPEREGGLVMPQADATRAEVAWALMTLAMLGEWAEPVPPTYAELAGSYQDSWSQRAMMTAEALGEDGLKLVIDWADSAAACAEWTMTVRYDESGLLSYTDGVEKYIVTDEECNQTETLVAEDQAGSFALSGNSLLWNGAPEENCRECCFIRPQIIGMPNPMVEVTAEELMNTLGLSIPIPASVSDARFFIIGGQMAEAQFSGKGMDVTARIQPAVEFTDISGCYYDWTSQADCTVGGLPGTVMRYAGEDGAVDVCLWYDAAPGLMYCVTVSAPDLSSLDIAATVGMYFVPVQGEA